MLVCVAVRAGASGPVGALTSDRAFSVGGVVRRPAAPFSVCVWTWRDQNWKLRLGVDIGLAEMPFFFPFVAQRVVGREGPKEPQVAVWGMFRESGHANYGLLTAFADKTCASDVHDGFEVHSDGISGGAAQVARSRDRPAGLAAAKEAIFLPHIR